MQLSLTIWKLINSTKIKRMKKELGRKNKQKLRKLEKMRIKNISQARRKIGALINTKLSVPRMSNSFYALIQWDKIKNSLKKRSIMHLNASNTTEIHGRESRKKI